MWEKRKPPIGRLADEVAQRANGRPAKGLKEGARQRGLTHGRWEGRSVAVGSRCSAKGRLPSEELEAAGLAAALGS